MINNCRILGAHLGTPTINAVLGGAKSSVVPIVADEFSAESNRSRAVKESQRVAWCVKGKTSPIVELGLSNLTQDTAPALLHFNDGQWLMVRLDEPKEKP